MNSESAIVFAMGQKCKVQNWMAKGGTRKKNCNKIKVYCIKNDRTDHTKSTEREKMIEIKKTRPKSSKIAKLSNLFGHFE